MKIKVWDNVLGKEILSGKYSYLEGGTTEGFPSFHISLFPGDEEIHFYCESKEELDDLIQSLKEIKDEVNKD